MLQLHTLYLISVTNCFLAGGSFALSWIYHRDQPGLRQRFQHLGHGRRFQPGLFGEAGGAQHLARPRGEYGQDQGGVVGELGDAEHGGNLEIVPKLYAFGPARSNAGFGGHDSHHPQGLTAANGQGVRAAENRLRPSRTRNPQ